MATLFKSPPVFDLPLTRGDDLSVRFTYKEPVLDVDGDPVVIGGKKQYQIADYPAGAKVTLELDTRGEKKIFNAVISGPYATIHEAFTLMDTIPAGVPWRAKIIYVGGLTKVAAEGETTRDRR
ncbi:MAG: hypothetical protein WBH51_01500 [Mycolicibacter algericus]|uniref:LtfC-like domain-containing protein n=1 Tax=Mycolicibacter algericus TaxID=1288388 RepID=UPI003C73CBC3